MILVFGAGGRLVSESEDLRYEVSNLELCRHVEAGPSAGPLLASAIKSHPWKAGAITALCLVGGGDYAGLIAQMGGGEGRDGLRRILELSPETVSDEDLERIAQIQDQFVVRRHYPDCNQPMFETQELALDLSLVRQLAKQELSRRRSEAVP